MAGEFRGVLWVEGEAVEAFLELGQSGSGVTGTLRSQAGLSGEGTGTASGRSLRMVFPYRIECPGTFEMEGDLTADGLRIQGRFQAVDCTGSARGSFEFRRR